jgi:hypothetical protein
VRIRFEGSVPSPVRAVRAELGLGFGQRINKSCARIIAAALHCRRYHFGSVIMRPMRTSVGNVSHTARPDIFCNQAERSAVLSRLESDKTLDFDVCSHDRKTFLVRLSIYARRRSQKLRILLPSLR